MQVLIASVTLPNADSLKKLVYELKNEVSKACIVLAATIDNSPQVAVFIDESLLEETGLHAGNLVRYHPPKKMEPSPRCKSVLCPA